VGGVAVEASSAVSSDLPVGGEWLLSVRVLDESGCPVEVVPVATITPPTGPALDPLTLERIGSGRYAAVTLLEDPGRYVAVVTATGHGTATFAAWVSDVVDAGAMPDADDIDVYLGDHSYTDEWIDDALATEAAAQRRVCDIPAEYEPDLAGALKRRCAVHLAKRRLPLLVLQGDAEAGTVSAFIPRMDAEVRRLEAPFRKLMMG
jgi:hypothetical protein